jgi:hypothetical protein
MVVAIVAVVLSSPAAAGLARWMEDPLDSMTHGNDDFLAKPAFGWFGRHIYAKLSRAPELRAVILRRHILKTSGVERAARPSECHQLAFLECRFCVEADQSDIVLHIDSSQFGNIDGFQAASVDKLPNI